VIPIFVTDETFNRSKVETGSEVPTSEDEGKAFVERLKGCSSGADSGGAPLPDAKLIGSRDIQPINSEILAQVPNKTHSM